VPVGRDALHRRVHAHRRHHDPVWDHHIAQAERLEHGRERALDVHVEVLGLHLPRERAIDLVDELGGPKPQVVIGDGLCPRHHAKGELDRVEIPEPVHMLEPN
jgi:hypothetical protein